MQSNKDKTVSSFLDNLTEFITDFEGLTQEELNEELREEGIDPENFLSKVDGLVKSKIKESKMAWKNEAIQKKESLLKIMSKVKFDRPKMSELKEKILDKFSGIQGGDHALAFFRNLEEVTEEDLESLYEELEMLEHLEDQVKEDNKE